MNATNRIVFLVACGIGAGFALAAGDGFWFTVLIFAYFGFFVFHAVNASKF